MSDLSFVNMVLDGLQRKLAKPKVRKEPVTREMIFALVNSLGKIHLLLMCDWWQHSIFTL